MSFIALIYDRTVELVFHSAITTNPAPHTIHPNSDRCQSMYAPSSEKVISMAEDDSVRKFTI